MLRQTHLTVKRAFIEFKQKFYPTLFEFDITPTTAGQKLFYDAAYTQMSKQHILGIFAGGAYTDGEEWGSVHCAARSAKQAVATIAGLS